jgi:hypothetical protein
VTVAFQSSRIRASEWMVGAASAVLLASMFLSWYGLSGPLVPTASRFVALKTTANGWQSLTVLRWLILVTAIFGLAVWYLQGSRRSPALPISLTVITTVVALITSLAVIYRVVINEPGAYSQVNQRFGAFVGMFSAIAIFIGGYRSMRVDGIAQADAPAEIETIRISASR